MFSVDFSSKRLCVVALLWAWLLFRSRCDDVLVDGGTSELGVVGAPDVEVDTVTITTTIMYNPDSSTDGATTVANDGDAESGSTEVLTPTSPDTGTSLSSPTTTISGIQQFTSVSQPSEALSNAQASSDIPTKPTSTSMSSSLIPSSTSTSKVSTPNTPGTLHSSAIGAIAGSISGAIILFASVFLCFRAYKRKKQRQEAHESIELDKPQEDKRWYPRRLIPSAIDTTGIHRPRDFDGNDRGSVRHAHGGHDSSIGVAIDGTDLVPTTPALESGRRRVSYAPHTNLHSRRISAASPTSGRDSLYYRLLDEVKAGPAQPELLNATAASSAVEWRDPQTPLTATAGAFNFDFNRKHSGSGLVVTNPTPAARPDGTLGDRAWHRRKLSTTFQPPPSGPPSIPLPPTPPARNQRSIDSVMLSSMPGSASKPKRQSIGSQGRGKKGGLGLTESTEALIQPQDLYTLGEPANISTIALGPSPAPTPPPKDDLVMLPNTRYEGPKEEGKEKGKDEKESIEQEEQSPTLPLIFRSGQSDGTRGSVMHAVGVGGQDMTTNEERTGQEREKEQKQKQEQEIPKRPESTSTIGTSILFPSEDET